MGRAADAELEYRVKAAFLFYFVNFVQWPATAFDDAQSPLSLCVLGMDPFGPALDGTVGGKRVGGRLLAVRRLASTEESRSCQVLFIARSEESRLRRILQGVRELPMLTVSESPDALRLGSIAMFVIEDGKVRFDISLPAARDAGLKVSSKLLGVAHRVER